jgi:hypothetical protein
MSRLYAFDLDRPHALFIADAYEGGRAWDVPSAPVLGTATLYGHRVITATEGESAGRQVVVEETRGDVRTYLVPWPGETERDFDRRRRLAVYVNVIEPIVDAYVDAIVPRVTRSLGDAAPMLANLDGDGQAWPEFGKTISQTQVGILMERGRDRPVVLIPDTDDPESYPAFVKVAGLIQAAGYGGNIGYAPLPPNTDPANLTQAQLRHLTQAVVGACR